MDDNNDGKLKSDIQVNSNNNSQKSVQQTMTKKSYGSQEC